MNDAFPATVFVVDDDKTARDAMCALAHSMEIPARGFSSAEEFLDFYRDQPGCLVVDYRLGGLSGLELIDELERRGHTLPVVLVTAFSRTPIVVKALKSGALTVLDKPYDEDDLWCAIRDGLALDRTRRQTRHRRDALLKRFDSLADREVDVLRLILGGLANKEMASRLNVSLRTIENRRRKVFTKVGVGSVAELVTAAMTVRIDRPDLLG
ncbi:MAG: response regulator transcription factor [Planctomycetales bacterium]|nr:response regulator transcription factor [Planctomycetales bacterium]